MDYFIDDKLVAVGILDIAKTSVSSNYFYFDPDYSDRSLGVLSTLKEIEFAKQNDKPFYYLGFYIEESDKMRYKSEFQPAQVRIKDKWVDFDKTKLTIYKSSNKGK
jgi:arginine-tRNA-protein transferase